MARTALPVTSAVANGIVSPTPTAIDQANGMVITMPAGTIPTEASTDRLILVVNNTFAGTKTVTLRAGANNQYLNYPASRAALGDLVLTAPASGISYLGPFELSRFTQGGSPETLNVDFQSGITGTILPVLLPRVV